MIIPLTPTSLAVAVALDREAFSRPQGSEFTIRELMNTIMSNDSIQKVDVASIQETAALLRAVAVYSADPSKDMVTYISILAAGGMVDTRKVEVPLAEIRFAPDPKMIVGNMAVRLGAEMAKSWPTLLARIDDIHTHQQDNPADTQKEGS